MKYYAIKKGENQYWAGERYYPKWIYGIDPDCLYDSFEEAKEEMDFQKGDKFDRSGFAEAKVVCFNLVEEQP
jgi:hypothetical protein